MAFHAGVSVNILIKKLSGYGALPEADAAALDRACLAPIELPANRRIIDEGDRPDHVLVMLAGWAIRYKVLKDGSRQILAFLIPGDICDMSASVTREMDHSVGSLTPVTLARIPRKQMEDLLAERPMLTRAFLWAQMVDEAVLRAWLVSLGRRDALERAAHLFCELWARARNVGLALNHGIALPITQEELSDALGLTAVHVNRVLQRLRSDGLLDWRKGVLDIPDITRLAAAAGFDANYLHRSLGGAGADDDADDGL